MLKLNQRYMPMRQDKKNANEQPYEHEKKKKSPLYDYGL